MGQPLATQRQHAAQNALAGLEQAGNQLELLALHHRTLGHKLERACIAAREGAPAWTVEAWIQAALAVDLPALVRAIEDPVSAAGAELRSIVRLEGYEQRPDLLRRGTVVPFRIRGGDADDGTHTHQG
jgi:hypothetical protein